MSLQQWRTFTQTVSSGTPVRLTTTRILTRDFIIQYHKDNNSDIYVGDENVDSDSFALTATPQSLAMGEMEQVRGSAVQMDLSAIWIATDGTSQKVTVGYLEEVQP